MILTSENREIKLRGRLNGSQRNKLAKLEDMWYRPRELAEEIGFNYRQFSRVYFPYGLPYDVDEYNGYVYINGAKFREWYLEAYKKPVIGPNEVFCKTCRKPVEIISPREHQRHNLVYWLSACPNCGRTCSRIIRKLKGNNDKSK